MKYSVKVGSVVMICISSSIKIGSGIQKLIGKIHVQTHTHTHTHTQTAR
jgi:hypothetical protein